MNSGIKKLSLKRGRLARFALVLVSFLSIVTVSSASMTSTAYAWGENCPVNNLCAWEHVDGGGALKTWGGTPSGCFTLVGQYLDNKISSLWNRLPRAVTFYDKTDCTAGGAYVVHNVPAGGWNSSFGWWEGKNDRFSSVYFH
jgi:hypothetical protein